MVDDNEDDRIEAAVLASDDLEVVSVVPSADLMLTIGAISTLLASDRPVVALIDYRLDVPSGVTYRGGTLAGALRDNFPTVPLVLYTSDAVMRAYLDARPRSVEAFDRTIEKNHLVGRELAASSELAEIARGFRTIAEMGAEGEMAVNEVLAVPEQIVDQLDQLLSDGLRAPAGLASWIMNDVLPEDGPLLDRLQAAAHLGLTLDSFDSLISAGSATDIEYKGIFSGLEPRWWMLALETLSVSEDSVPSVKRAACNWCGQRVERSCSICNEPCGQEHCLPVRRALQPRWTRGRVACFACVESGRVDASDIDEMFEEIVTLIVTGQIRG
ncbi:hypothetical protein [Curtobacterium flaccumfaciens]|uniref:hypothetical protein n=1 Tax=Curtobacterium flaccumfaciens TaxID=2035 RepID=UPI001AD9A9B4|nr:hypothetical protein [Curtobacterium flaccumfaciens]MBO9051630.1 hypothetical protein [Curtobacterium flaccumfaciens pv. flaccumfaciens]